MATDLIKFRRGLASLWTSRNPVLAAGEPGYETDTGKHKIGDGTSDWATLDYVEGAGGGGASAWGDITGTLSAQTDLQAALDAKLASATAASTYQPLDSDLTAIAALTTTSYGRAFLALADASAGKTALSIGSVENTALSTWSGSTAITTLGTIATGTVPVANVSGLGSLATQSGTFSGTSSGTNTGDQSAASLGLVIGTNVQAYDADLTTWAGITPGTGVGTALTVNVGSAGAVLVNGGALGTPSGGTVTNLTGTASININGTVGATTPTTGAFTTINGNTFTTGTGTLTIAASKILTANNTLTLAGTDGTTMTFPTTTATIARTDASQTFTGPQVVSNGLYANVAALSSGRYMHGLRLGAAKVRAGTADLKVLCIGDSTTFGTSSGGSPLALASWPSRVVGLIADSIPAADGIINPKNAASHPDSRWTYGTGWSVTAFGFGAISGSGCATGTNPAGNLTYTPGGSTSYDSFDVYYLKNTGLGTITITATGGTPSVVSTAGTPAGVYKATVAALTAGTGNDVTISGTGAVYIVGVEPFHSTTRRVRMGNVGVGSTKSAEWAATGNFSTAQAITTYAPDVVIINIGINDAGSSVSASTFYTNMATIIALCQSLNASVILLSTIPSSGSPHTTFEPQYQAQLLALANTYNVPLIDIWQRFGATWQTSLMTDTLHPNAVGYWDIGSSVASFIKSVIV